MLKSEQKNINSILLISFGFFHCCFWLIWNFSWFAGTFYAFVSAVCITLGERGGQGDERRFLKWTSKTLCKIHVPMPIHWRTFDLQTTRQVEVFEYCLLGSCIWTLRLKICTIYILKKTITTVFSVSNVSS